LVASEHYPTKVVVRAIANEKPQDALIGMFEPTKFLCIESGYWRSGIGGQSFEPAT